MKIFSTTRQPDTAKPGTNQAAREVSGTGVVIEGKRTLTSADVVLYASQIQMHPNQSREKLTATVESLARGIDLPVLKLEAETFFDTHLCRSPNHRNAIAIARRHVRSILNSMKAILLAALGAGLLLSSTGASDEPLKRVARFSELPPGNRLEITYEGRHPDFYAECTYYPRKLGEFAVREKQFSRSGGRPWSEGTLVPLGGIKLEAGEAKKLDELISVYRLPKNRDYIRLTGNVTVTIRQLRGYKLIAEETFRDPEDHRELPPGKRLDFWMLVAALKKT